MTECPRATCHAPDTGCVLGLVPCEHFIAGTGPDDADADAGRGLPWSGLALGSSDLPAVAAVGRLQLVALVGAANSGKTTALAAHWLAARRGDGRFGRSFAGSFTLLGWHQIARHLQWQPFGSGFPPHTTATDNRVPSLLHVRYCTERAFAHVAFADVPGEWYRAWAYDDQATPGATWIADHADAFALLSDSEALAGPERGLARGDYETLANRVADVTRGRPVLPFRTKADVAVPSALSDHVDAVNRDRFGAETVRVSIRPDAGAGLTEVLDAATDAALARRRRPIDLDHPEGEADPFLRFRSLAGRR